MMSMCRSYKWMLSRWKHQVQFHKLNLLYSINIELMIISFLD